MVQVHWEIGRKIMEAQGGSLRAEYGKGLLKFLAEKLTAEFGFICKMRQFHRVFQIRDTLCPELSWSQYRLLMRITNENERYFYMREAAECDWSVRQLERNINTLYSARLLKAPEHDKDEIQKIRTKRCA